jgi:hypothetical protein
VHQYLNALSFVPAVSAARNLTSLSRLAATIVSIRKTFGENYRSLASEHDIVTTSQLRRNGGSATYRHLHTCGRSYSLSNRFLSHLQSFSESLAFESNYTPRLKSIPSLGSSSEYPRIKTLLCLHPPCHRFSVELLLQSQASQKSQS